MISKADLGELRRLATNAYDDDKLFVGRLINEINNMQSEILRLRNENTTLRAQAQAQDAVNVNKV